MEYKFTNEDLNLNKVQRNNYSDLLSEFLISDMKNCEISFNNSKEYHNARSSLTQIIKRRNLNICIFSKRQKIYLIKA